MKPLNDKLLLKESRKELKRCIKHFKKIRKEEEEEGGFSRIRCGTLSSIEYWIGRIEILCSNLSYSQKEMDELTK